jgi:hypothetical protein
LSREVIAGACAGGHDGRLASLGLSFGLHEGSEIGFQDLVSEDFLKNYRVEGLGFRV